MKSVLSICKLIIVLIGMSFLAVISACNSPVTGSSQQKEVKALKMIDKNTLLSIVADLSTNMSKKHCSVMEAIEVLKPYSSAYKINIEHITKPFNSSKEYLSVYFVKSDKDTSKIFFCSLVPPQSIYKQITFNDFKQKLGDWEKTPLNARPKEAPYILTSFNYRNAPNISILVESKKLPEYSDNSIEQIKITPSRL